MLPPRRTPAALPHRLAHGFGVGPKVVSRLTSNIGRGPQDLDRAAPADASAVAVGANVDRYARGGRPHRNGGRPADRRRPLHPCRRIYSAEMAMAWSALNLGDAAIL